jgi:hypothetical protein
MSNEKTTKETKLLSNKVVLSFFVCGLASLMALKLDSYLGYQVCNELGPKVVLTTKVFLVILAFAAPMVAINDRVEELKSKIVEAEKAQ